MLAADDAALRVIDETARVYDAETLVEALWAVRREWAALVRLESVPWSRSSLMRIHDGPRVVDACDAILRRRAGTP